jgi:hypothetical protein
MYFAAAIKNEAPTGTLKALMEQQAASCMKAAMGSFPAPQ